jgi:hypothetical protein
LLILNYFLVLKKYFLVKILLKSLIFYRMKFDLGTCLAKIKIIPIHKAASFFLVPLIKNKIILNN